MFVHGQKIGRKLVKKSKGRNCKEGQVRFKLRSGLRNGGEETEDESTALESPMRGPAKNYHTFMIFILVCKYNINQTGLPMTLW